MNMTVVEIGKILYLCCKILYDVLCKTSLNKNRCERITHDQVQKVVFKKIYHKGNLNLSDSITHNFTRAHKKDNVLSICLNSCFYNKISIYI